MIENRYEFPISIDSFKWAIEQAIINRNSNESMMSAVKLDMLNQLSKEQKNLTD